MICGHSDIAHALSRWDFGTRNLRANRLSASSTHGTISTPATAIFPERVQDIKRGITANGGFAVELPALSLGEQLMKPSAMLYRNLLAMEVEELLRAYPIDGAVVMAGCDKTTPGVLMGAITANYPTIYVPAGPMLRGNWRGEKLGSGADVWKYWDERRAGNITHRDMARN